MVEKAENSRECRPFKKKKKKKRLLMNDVKTHSIDIQALQRSPTALRIGE